MWIVLNERGDIAVGPFRTREEAAAWVGTCEGKVVRLRGPNDGQDDELIER